MTLIRVARPGALTGCSPRGPAACQPRVFPQPAARHRQSVTPPWGTPKPRRPSSRVILTLHRCPPSPPPPPPPSRSAPPPRKRRNTPRSRLTGRLGGPGPRPPLRPRRPRMRRPPTRTLRGRGLARARFTSAQPGLPATHAPPPVSGSLGRCEGRSARRWARELGSPSSA